MSYEGNMLKELEMPTIEEVKKQY